MNKFVKQLSGWKYWGHIVLIAVLVLGSLQLLFGGDMFTFMNVLISVPLLAFADIISHFVFGLD